MAHRRGLGLGHPSHVLLHDVVPHTFTPNWLMACFELKTTPCNMEGDGALARVSAHPSIVPPLAPRPPSLRLAGQKDTNRPSIPAIGVWGSLLPITWELAVPSIPFPALVTDLIHVHLKSGLW
jgi:hypothetical protein